MPVSRNKVRRLYLRISADDLCFAVYHPFGGRPPVVESYDVNPTASLNVNLREALKIIPLAQESYGSVEVLLNVPYTLVPLERFDEDNLEKIYRFNFHDAGNDRIFYDVAGSLGAVMVYGIDDVLCRVIDDAFPSVHYTAAITAVANRFAEEARASHDKQIYAYRHEGATDIFAFASGRLLLGNRYATRSADDAAYYTLFAARTLDFDLHDDEFDAIDTHRDGVSLATRLQDFAHNVRAIDAAATFGRHPLVSAADMPYDMISYLVQPY